MNFLIILLVLFFISCYFIYFFISKFYFRNRPARSENEKWWTTLYFGSRGSGKSQHQAKEVIKIFNWLEYIYKKYPSISPKHAIVYSIQRFSLEIEKKYLGKLLYYWNDAKDIQYCPRINCWKGIHQHRLHGCYLIFDDIAAMFPCKPKFNMPTWLIKTFSQVRKFGVRILANAQDPFSIDIDFRRYVDMAFKFRKIISTRDPDETKPPLTLIFGIYQRRRIKAELLWEYGDMSEVEIKLLHQKEEAKAKTAKLPNLYSGMWRGSLHLITRKNTNIYDTQQEIPEYVPKGYLHIVRKCIDPNHNHTNPDAENFCDFEKVIHELV